MQKLNDLDQFDRATLVKQKTGALLTGFITTPNENPLSAAQADDGAWTASLEPGTIQRLSPGESLEFSDPPETGGYSEYAKTQLRLIASGLRFAVQRVERRPVGYEVHLGAGGLDRIQEVYRRRAVAIRAYVLPS
jgi:capsid protein